METMKRFNHKRELFIALGIVVVIVFILTSIISFLLPNRRETYSPIAYVPTPTTVPKRTIWIDPARIETKPFSQFEVRVMLDADNRIINGADAVISYDPSYLKLVSMNKANEPNNQFQLFSRQSIGEVQLTAIKLEQSSSSTAQATIAVLVFQSLKTGSSELTFEFQKGATFGSTIIDANNSENILENV